MKVKATKTMTKELNKVAKASGIPYRFEYIEVPLDTYRFCINYDYFEAYDYGDYDISTGKVKAIEVVYPSEWYACPQYLTTARLHSLYEKGDTLESYLVRVVENCEC